MTYPFKYRPFFKGSTQPTQNRLGRKSCNSKQHWPVLYNPVFLAVHILSLEAVTHHQHTVVQLLAAAFLLIVDSWNSPQKSSQLHLNYVKNRWPVLVKKMITMKKIIIKKKTKPQNQELTWLIKLERLVTGVDGDWDRSHGGHSLHQSALLATGDVHESGVIGGVVLGVIVTRLVILEDKKKMMSGTLHRQNKPLNPKYFHQHFK